MAGLWESIWCFLFPPRCPACGAYVEGRGGWCPDCLGRTLTPHLLPISPTDRRFMDGVWALGRYHDVLRGLILPLKYRGRRDRLPYIRAFLAAARDKLPEELAPPGLAVPVPLHRDREKQRGFNQSELIFRDWLTDQGWQWQNALTRVRPTQPQHGLDAAARAENIKGAFALTEDAPVQGQPVLLVDDIYTTGATALACAKALRDGGASRVQVLVLASDRL